VIVAGNISLIFYSIISINIPASAKNTHKGEKYLVSLLAKSVFLMRLVNPTYLKSPKALKAKMADIIQPRNYLAILAS
jgi:hypothetical protein